MPLLEIGQSIPTGLGVSVSDAAIVGTWRADDCVCGQDFVTVLQTVKIPVLTIQSGECGICDLAPPCRFIPVRAGVWIKSPVGVAEIEEHVLPDQIRVRRIQRGSLDVNAVLLAVRNPGNGEEEVGYYTIEKAVLPHKLCACAGLAGFCRKMPRAVLRKGVGAD